MPHINKDQVKILLGSLIQDLKHLEMRTMQSCIDLNIDSIESLRITERINVIYIVSIILQETGVDIKAPQFRTMIYRSLNKIKVIEQQKNNTKKPQKIETNVKSNTHLHTTTIKDVSDDSYYTLDNWNNHFNFELNDRIINRLKILNLKIEFITTKNFPNPKRLSDFLIQIEQQMKYKI